MITETTAARLRDLGLIQNDSLLFYHKGQIERFVRSEGSVSAFIGYEIEMFLPGSYHMAWQYAPITWGNGAEGLATLLIWMIENGWWTAAAANNRYIEIRQQQDLTV